MDCYPVAVVLQWDTTHKNTYIIQNNTPRLNKTQYTNSIGLWSSQQIFQLSFDHLQVAIHNYREYKAAQQHTINATPKTCRNIPIGGPPMRSSGKSCWLQLQRSLNTRRVRPKSRSYHQNRTFGPQLLPDLPVPSWIRPSGFHFRFRSRFLFYRAGFFSLAPKPDLEDQVPIFTPPPPPWEGGPGTGFPFRRKSAIRHCVPHTVAATRTPGVHSSANTITGDVRQEYLRARWSKSRPPSPRTLCFCSSFSLHRSSMGLGNDVGVPLPLLKPLVNETFWNTVRALFLLCSRLASKAIGLTCNYRRLVSQL
jgi:hypothetical protein